MLFSNDTVCSKRTVPFKKCATNVFSCFYDRKMDNKNKQLRKIDSLPDSLLPLPVLLSFPGLLLFRLLLAHMSPLPPQSFYRPSSAAADRIGTFLPKGEKRF